MVGGGSGSNQQVVQLSEAEKKKQIAAAQANIKQLKTEFKNPKSLIYKIYADAPKREAIHFWARNLKTVYLLTGQPEKVKNIANEITKDLITMGVVKQAHTYAYDVLDSEYKSHRQNPGNSDDPSDNSSLNTAVFEQENEPWLHAIDLFKSGLNLVANKMRTGHFVKLIKARRPGESDADYKTRMEEFDQDMKMVYWSILLLHEAFDDRQGVAAATQHFLLAAAILINIDEASSYYFEDVKGKFSLTRKQTRKIIMGYIRSAFNNNNEVDVRELKKIKGKLHIALEPKEPWQARLRGFSGHKCPRCGCLRCELKVNLERGENEPEWQDYCYGCERWFIGPVELLYQDRDAVTIDGAFVIDGKGNKIATLAEPEKIDVPKH